MSLNLPKWKCHKIVGAAPITTVTDTLLTLKVSDVDGHQFQNVTADPKWFARGKPQEGDYLVEYEDGYISWSPKKAFEDGYALEGD